MQQNRLLARLEKLRREREEPWGEVSIRMGYRRAHISSRISNLKNGDAGFSLNKLCQLAQAINHIPLAFYITKSREIETLDNPSFITGQFPHGYVRKALQKHRRLAGLTEQALEQRIKERQEIAKFLRGIDIQQYEAGTKTPSIRSVEYICDALGLIPEYLIRIPAPTKLILP